MRFTGNGITNCYPDQVEDFISITVLTGGPSSCTGVFHSPARRPLPRCWRDEQADGGGEHAAEDEPLTSSEAKACSDLVERFGALRPDERWMTAPRGEVAERADASIRQDSVTQAAWRRFQPLRRSSPRGRPRASYWGSPPIAAFPPDASGSMAADTAGPNGTCSRTFALRARDLDRRAIRRERTTETYHGGATGRPNTAASNAGNTDGRGTGVQATRKRGLPEGYSRR